MVMQTVPAVPQGRTPAPNLAPDPDQL